MKFSDRLPWPDYRKSHLDIKKAIEYDNGWSDGSTYNLLWKIEQNILLDEMEKMHIYPKSVLDFACGTGRILSFLEKYIDCCTGIDVSNKMLSIAQKKCHKSRLVLGDLTRDPKLIQDKFDMVTAFRFFLNAQEDLRQNAMTSIRSIMKEDGYLIANFHFNPISLTGFIQRTLNKFRNIERRMLSVENAIKMFESSGFEVESIRGYGYLLQRQKRPPLKSLQYVIESKLAKMNIFPTLGFCFLIAARKTTCRKGNCL